MGFFSRRPQTTAEPRLAFTCSDKEQRDEFAQRYRDLPSRPLVRVEGDSVTVQWTTWANYNADSRSSGWPRNLAGLTFTLVPQEPEQKGQPAPPASTPPGDMSRRRLPPSDPPPAAA